MDVDLIKVGELYTKEAIAKVLQEVQDKAQVSIVSKEGNAKTDKRFTKKRVEIAAQKKIRIRKQFPSIDALKQS
eukprot:2863526-Ditylum_brightwellii.AAC.1